MIFVNNEFQGKKALIADDFLVNQEMMEEMLQLLGFSVDTADDGGEAIQLWQENTYDIIFMDIQMPVKNGYEVTKYIREQEKNLSKRTLILALTANAQAGDREKCIESGMDGYISKPIEIKQLRNKVLEIFNLNSKP
ncbi:MAG: response regulator [Parachlamydiales bacterium]|jgi:CheY-like chemotaxis protein